MAIDKDRVMRRLKNRLARTEKRAQDIADVGGDDDTELVASRRRRTLASRLSFTEPGMSMIRKADERMSDKLDEAGASTEEKNTYFSGKQKLRARRGMYQGGVFKF